MNLNPTNQLSLYNHYFELTNFINLYKNQILPNKILLSGEKGIGKSTLAYHIINYVLSIDEDYSYDLKNFKINAENKSFKLILNKSNPNFISIDIEEDKKSIDINQIRNLILSLNKSSFNKKPRFVLIDNIASSSQTFFHFRKSHFKKVELIAITRELIVLGHTMLVR